MSDRYSELGVAGYLSVEQEQMLDEIAFDVDVFHSIGIAGPVSPELLMRIAEVGPQKVATMVHMSIAGPVDPEELDALLDFGVQRIQDVAGRGPFDSASELLSHLRGFAADR